MPRKKADPAELEGIKVIGEETPELVPESMETASADEVAQINALDSDETESGETTAGDDAVSIHEAEIEELVSEENNEKPEVLDPGEDSSHSSESVSTRKPKRTRKTAAKTSDTVDTDQVPEIVQEDAAGLKQIAEGASLQEPVPESEDKMSYIQEMHAADNEGETQYGEQQPNPLDYRQPRENVLALDAERQVETQADKHANDVLDLYESLKSNRILTDFIQGVEVSPNNRLLSYAVIYHGDLKVIIPASETVEPPEELHDRRLEDVMHYLITKRMGAEIDYVIQHIDKETGIAAGSRLEAMAIRRRQMYYGIDYDGNNLVYEGVCAEARIISVIRTGVFADVLGVEQFIPNRELSYQRFVDASQYYAPGQRIVVRIMSLERLGKPNVKIEVSAKLAADNPYEKALRKFTIGNRYVGKVSMVNEHGVFVAMDGGVDCLCPYPPRGRPPRGARVTVRILGIENETSKIWGVITHMSAV